jgi:hypothetical protein
VILVLQNPKEKILGVLQEVNSAGVFLRGIDLNYFEDLINSIKKGEEYLPMQDYFFPMWRVEKLMRDERSLGTQSLAEQFFKKTGLELKDI